MKTLNDYFTMNYRMEIVEDKDEGGFVVSFPELPGCITCGETVESAVANALDAKKAWLEAAMEDGIEIHEPDTALKRKCRQKLYPAVCLPRMSVHDASCYLYKLSYMPCQKHPLKAHIGCHINCFTDKVGAFDTPVQIIAIAFLHKVKTVISRRNRHIIIPKRISLPKLHPYRINKSL